MQISSGKRANLIAAVYLGSLGALGSLVGCSHHHHTRHGGHAEGFSSGISVSGTGEAFGAPDIARTTAGVEVRGNTAEEATSFATVQMEKLLDALKASGIAPADLRTQGYSVSYERDYVPQPQPMPARSVGRMASSAAPAQPSGRYLVTNSVEITVRHVAELGRVLSAAIGAGANNVWGISFDIENKEPLVTKAREAAFAQARARAERIAALSGVELGPLVAVDDSGEGGRVIGVRAASAMSLREAVPVERGELAVSHTVQLQFALGEAKSSLAAPAVPPPPARPAAPPAPVPPAPVVAPPAPVVAPPAPPAPPLPAATLNTAPAASTPATPALAAPSAAPAAPKVVAPALPPAAASAAAPTAPKASVGVSATR
jgi:uncharacterized protein